MTPGSNDWWIVRRITTSDVRRPWYELSDEDRAALGVNAELRQIIELLAVERPNGEIRSRWNESTNLREKVPGLGKYVPTYREQRIAQLKAELALLEAQTDG